MGTIKPACAVLEFAVSGQGLPNFYCPGTSYTIPACSAQSDSSPKELSSVSVAYGKILSPTPSIAKWVYLASGEHMSLPEIGAGS